MSLLTSTTLLEDWITYFYKRLHIYHPREIKEDFICKQLRIFLKKHPLPSSFEIVGRYQGIRIDSRASPEEQRLMFFHELCHILRHTGNQLTMPKMFRELQEFDANNFSRIAAIPNHMLKYIDFNSKNVISEMVDLFKVPESICEERVSHIRHRINKMELIHNGVSY